MDRGIFVARAESKRSTLAEALKRYEHEISAAKAHPAQDNQRIRHRLRQPPAHHAWPTSAALTSRSTETTAWQRAGPPTRFGLS